MVRERVAVRKWYGIVIQKLPCKMGCGGKRAENSPQGRRFLPPFHRYLHTGGKSSRCKVSTKSGGCRAKLRIVMCTSEHARRDVRCSHVSTESGAYHEQKVIH